MFPILNYLRTCSTLTSPSPFISYGICCETDVGQMFQVTYKLYFKKGFYDDDYLANT